MPGPHVLPVSERLLARFDAKVDRSGGPDACHPWRGAKSRKRRGSRRGHLIITLPGGRRIWVLAHVVAIALATDGEIVKFDPATGKRLEVCHRCHAIWGDCMNVKHLQWGTAESNRADRYRRAG